jgi:hypothetical protein
MNPELEGAKTMHEGATMPEKTMSTPQSQGRALVIHSIQEALIISAQM